MINNTLRQGNFTSSEIVALTTVATDKKSFGKPALTYIRETNMERRLGRSLTTEVKAKATLWGKILEQPVFDKLGIEYTLSSTETDVHPTIPYWAGSKDGMKFDEGRTVIDIKAPFTLQSFCQLVDPLYQGLSGIEAMNAVRDGYKKDGKTICEAHKDGEKFYWQLVSNAIINDAQFAELIVYAPYKEDLPSIRMLADGLPAYYWLAMSDDDELPSLIKGGYYKDVNIIRFEVPQADKDHLTALVKKAGAMLINQPQK